MNEMNESKGKKKTGNTVLLTVIGVATLLVAVVGATFAFFTANVTVNEGDGPQVIQLTAGTLTLNFDKGETIYVGGADALIYPRAEEWATKTFSITGSTDADVELSYKMALIVDQNTFGSDSGRQTSENTLGTPLRYTLTVKSTAGGNPAYGIPMSEVGTETITDHESIPNGTVIPMGQIPMTGLVQLGTGTFYGSTTGEAVTATHTYELKIFLPNIGINQNAEQQKVFAGHINTVLSTDSFDITTYNNE